MKMLLGITRKETLTYSDLFHELFITQTEEAQRIRLGIYCLLVEREV